VFVFKKNLKKLLEEVQLIFSYICGKMKILFTVLRFFLSFFVIISIAFLLFEWGYQNSIIDFYKSDFKALNTTENLNSKNIDFLVFGDSFSAHQNNYIDLLRNDFPELIFVNLSISGTGIKQVNTFAKKKIEKYQPKNIIYQVYVGNDLLDVRHISKSAKLSFGRTAYWKITDYLKSPIYLNQKLKGFNRSSVVFEEVTDSFSFEKYNSREKLLFKIDPSYLEKQVFLKSDFNNRYKVWEEELTIFLSFIPEKVNVYIVFVPHCSQIDEFYFNNMIKLGANFENTSLFENENYSFYNSARNDFEKFENSVFLNPLAFFKKLDTVSNRLYYENDPHFSRKGHRELSNYLKIKLFN